MREDAEGEPDIGQSWTAVCNMPKHMKWAFGEWLKSSADKKQVQATKCNGVAKQSKTNMDEVLFAMQATGCGTKLEQSRKEMLQSDDV